MGVRVGHLGLALASATWVERQGPKLDRSEFKSHGRERAGSPQAGSARERAVGGTNWGRQEGGDTGFLKAEIGAAYYIKMGEIQKKAGGVSSRGCCWEGR